MPGIIPTATVAYGTDSPNQVADIDRTTVLYASGGIAERSQDAQIRRILSGVIDVGYGNVSPTVVPSQSVLGICCGSCPQAVIWLPEHLAWLARHDRGRRRTQLTDEPSRESRAARKVPGFIVPGTVSRAALPSVSRQAADR
jgi:hypothetical protein